MEHKILGGLRYGVLALLLVLGGQPLRADIPIDLGPSRIATNEINRIAFSQLNGTPIAGTLGVDFAFSNDTFVRVFNEYTNLHSATIGTTHELIISLYLQTSGSGLVGFLRGTGYLTDRAGNRIPGYGVTGSGSSFDGGMGIGLFPLDRDENGDPDSSLARPFDFYGAHFDLIFPNAPSLVVTGADIGVYDSGGMFGIGPNIPLDIPEPSASMLAALGALALLRFRHRA